MKKTKIKICGLRRQEDIEIINKYKPDFAGFIIDFPKSYRSLTPDKASDLTKNLDKEIKSVGVFVDEDIDTVIRLLNENIIDIAQLHGHESPEYIKKVQKETGKKVIKCFIIKQENYKQIGNDDGNKEKNAHAMNSDEIAKKNAQVMNNDKIASKDKQAVNSGEITNNNEKAENNKINEIINEAKSSPADMVLLDAGYGSGKTFDWNLIRDIGRPFFLAGGLSADNIKAAIEELNPYAVDISSSVETDKYKDEKLVREIIEKVRWQSQANN